MLAYVCKYVPVEVFESMGTEMLRLQPSVADFNQADVLMHPNMCSYVKAVLEVLVGNTGSGSGSSSVGGSGGGRNYADLEGIVLTTCCDSVRRLYDVLKEKMPDSFIYILDVPRKVNEFSAGIYAQNIRTMITEYERFSGKKFSGKALKKLLERRMAAASLQEAPNEAGRRLRIGLAGTRCSPGIINLLQDHHVDILFDMTCTGLHRNFPSFEAEQLQKRDRDQEEGSKQDSGMPGDDWAVGSYCWDLLNQVPCMRMVKASGRERFASGFLDRLDGVICHTVKFCDVYAFEYAQLKEDLPVPLLQVETDSTTQSEGQIRTRVEAFLESLQMARHGNAQNTAQSRSLHTGASGSGSTVRVGNSKGEDSQMYVLGVDSGSTSTNAVILDQNKNIVAFHVIRTGAKSGDSAQRIREEILEKAGIDSEDLACIVSTGYGRVSIPYADENVTEISCHGRGAHYFNPAVRTVLDIGGQDSKAIALNERGEVTDFVMNDKCAAGTGRFLEMMARTLEIGVDELGPISLGWKENIEITSMCSVFAESEVISLIARNKEKPDIAHGIHNAIAGKAYSLMKRVGLRETYMMTGGVAKNPGVVKAVEEKLGSGLYICEQPEIVGALGAALYALEKVSG